MDKERMIIKGIGKCPFCTSKNYVRGTPQLVGDDISVDCRCYDCEGFFVETFVLKYQNWEEE